LISAFQRISELETNPGRVVPEAEDLVIGDGRRLDAAILFLDISGFSSWPSETAEEQKHVLALLNVFFTEMVRIAEDYSGTVEKNTGDGLLAYFEDKAADEGSKRAVACALTMIDTNDRLITPVLTSQGIQPIRFRIAINHGPVTIARLGAARRFNAIVAVGTAANVAAKMLSFAEADEIVIGEFVKLKLPWAWRVRWVQEMPGPTGWIYRLSGNRYAFHKYTGRWISPSVTL
jgi:class 3 adenylate cyclase